MRPLALALSITLALCVAAPVGAASYDGKWEARTNSVQCNVPRSFPVSILFTAYVRANALTGVISGARGEAKGTATIAADGTFSLQEGSTTVKGQFAGDVLKIDVTSSICPERTGTGGRVNN